MPLVEGLEITDVAAEGNALGRLETDTGQLVVFVPYGAPGDIADVQLEKKKKSFAQGRIVRLAKPSPIRVEPRCRPFGVCGGCRGISRPRRRRLPHPGGL